MSDPVEIISGLAAAGNLVNSLIGLANTAGNKQKLIEAHEAILAAQAGALSLQKEQSQHLRKIDDLERELTARDNWDRDAKGFELKEVVVGAFVYRINEDNESSSPRMYFCANCFQRREKSVLAARNVPQGRMKYLDCPQCNASLMIEGPGVQDIPPRTIILEG